MSFQELRNVAIIAHVDHGKTTLVDELFKQSGLFRSNQVVEERLMDSMDQEKERGITITAKNGAFMYGDYLVNIIDTPGHADFGGQVECVLKMADGVLLLVDAAEGPMPQTYFVLKKALHLGLPIIVVVNKIDKPDARPDWVIDQVFDLMVRLEAPDDALDFPVVYASAKEGYALTDPSDPIEGANMGIIYDMIVKEIPAPKGDPKAPLQMLVSLLSYNSFLGRLAIGKVSQGTLNINENVVVMKSDGTQKRVRVTKIYRFMSNEMKEIEKAVAGEVVAVAGLENVTTGETVADPINPQALPVPDIDPPTLDMNFLPNDSPFAGQEGDFVTSRHLKERLERELLSDVALQMEELTDRVGFRVSGRGELHLSVLIEKLRREGYELQVTRPHVIMKVIDGKKLEPYEELTVDVDEEYMGRVIEKLGERKAQLLDMSKSQGMVRIKYKIPTRGLLGFRSEFMSDTKGMGTMNSIFLEYGPYSGAMNGRKNGVLISIEQCTTVAYGLYNLQDRGQLFLGPGSKVYEGQVVGSHTRENDLVVNVSRSKKLTNVRASGTDDAVTLTPHRQMSLEDCLTFIDDDELVEATPKAIRLRKIHLKEVDRKRVSRKS